MTLQTMDRQATTERTPAGNSGFAKKRVQWLIEHSTSHQILWCIDSLVLRNPLLRKAANRYMYNCRSPEISKQPFFLVSLAQTKLCE